jgi:hypothetical protein
MGRACITAILVVAMFIAAGNGAVADDANCQLTNFAKFDMDVDGSGRVNVPISINGQTVHFLVDTGAAASIVSASTASLPGMRIFRSGRVYMELYGGSQTNAFVFVQNSAFGDMKPGYHPFFVVPDSRFPSGVAGLLGSDVLQNFDVEFDFANSQLGIFSQNHCAGRVVYWTRDPYASVEFTLDRAGHIRVPVGLNEGVTLGTIDSGAAETVGSLEDIIGGLHIEQSDPALKAVPDTKGQIHLYRYPFKTLTLDGVTVNNPDILLVPNDVSKLPPDQRQLIIGMNVLRHFHLYIAYGEHVMYVTPATAH